MTTITTQEPTEQTHLVDSSHSHRHDDSQHHSHHRSLAEAVPLYSRPVQLQRWGEEQILPHVNWNDLFFDLFLVAAAYNLDAIMEHDPSYQGLLYFVCCLLSVFTIWAEKLGYDGKFAPEDNLFHRTMEILHLAILGTVIQHIQPVSVLAYSSSNPDMMVFAGGLAVDSLFQIQRYGDLYHNVDGGEEARHQAKNDKTRKALGALVYLMAALVAGYEFFVKGGSGQNNLPIILCGCGYLVEHVFSSFQILVVLPKHERPFTELRVPMNLEFTLHRLGEFVMLMLGESVLSLLIAPQSKGARYYVTFYSGIITVTMLQYLFFRSQPFNIEDHAARRSAYGGLLFGEVLAIYAGCLIVFGGSYKLTLDQYLMEETMSPGSVVGGYTLEERRQRIANLFCWSLTISMLALDFMIMTHRGFKDNFARFCNSNGCLNPGPTISTLVDLGLNVFTVTLSQWLNSLELLSFIGFLVVLAHVLLRTFGLRFFPVSKAAMDLALGRTLDPTV